MHPLAWRKGKGWRGSSEVRDRQMVGRSGGACSPEEGSGTISWNYMMTHSVSDSTIALLATQPKGILTHPQGNTCKDVPCSALCCGWELAACTSPSSGQGGGAPPWPLVRWGRCRNTATWTGLKNTALFEKCVR